MQSTQSAQPWLGSLTALPESETESTPSSRARHPRDPRARPRARRPPRDRPAADRDRAAGPAPRTTTARDVVDTALESVTRLQIVTANIDACRPPSASFAGAALVALADSHLRGHADAIERGMAYTADNQLRLLLGEK